MKAYIDLFENEGDLKWQFRRHELYCQQVNVKLIVCTVHGTYKCRGHWNNAKSVT